MNLLSKVVWSEGMHLGPHHFQAQNRNFEDIIRFINQSLCVYPYGFSGLKLDQEAIRNGTVSVLHARGIFPDGLVFDFPESDASPAVLPINDVFSPVHNSLTLCLAVPPRRNQGRNCIFPEQETGDSRYAAVSLAVSDENTGADERAIRIGRKNLRLVPEDELNKEFVSLPVARVCRDGFGHFVYDSTFVPPCLQISSSDALMRITGRLIEILEEKSSSTNSSFAKGAGEFSSRQIASFWFSHAVNSALAALRHRWLSKQGHPEELFLEMLKLAGALCTFALDAHPSSLPVYHHDNLTECFQTLDADIRRHLELIIPTNCLTFSLKRSSESFYEAEINDSRCFGRAQWVLGVRSRSTPAELISRAPSVIKFCSSRFVGELVRRALPGLKLTHLAALPSAISRRIDTQYFGVTQAGPCWDHLVQTRIAGVFAPAEIPDPELELFVVLDS